MTRIVLAITIIFAAGVAVAQQRDFSTMSNAEFLDFLANRDNPSQQGNIEQATPGIKCPLDVTFESIRRRDMMSGSELALMEKLLAPPSYQKVITSPTGLFKVFYDTASTSANTPAMLNAAGFRIEGTYDEYAYQVALMFDSVYQKEVVELGYDAPPKPPYEIYLYEEGSGNYGATYYVGSALPSNTTKPVFATYIRMDNDFRYYYRSGLNGARVTAAHEFHHMIQLGRYGAWGDPDRYIYEMTSTLFEDIVYPDVDDYYQYLSFHFNAPQLPFYSLVNGLIGYQKAIFLEMLVKKYGLDLIRNFWENMKLIDPANSINKALVDESTDYSRELCRFSRWCYHTAYRSDEVGLAERFAEAERFPAVEWAGLTQLNSGRAEFNESLTAYGSQYFRVFRGADTVSFIVSNTDWSAALTNDSRNMKVPYSITVVDYQPGDPYTSLDNGWAYKFETSSANLLCFSAIVGAVAQEAPISTAYPNPFFPEDGNTIRFPMPAITVQQRANVYIYSSSMNLVYHADEKSIQSEETLGRFMEWNGRTDDGEIPPTGIYFYSIKFGDEVKKGKFALVRK